MATGHVQLVMGDRQWARKTTSCLWLMGSAVGKTCCPVSASQVLMVSSVGTVCGSVGVSAFPDRVLPARVLISRV